MKGTAMKAHPKILIVACLGALTLVLSGCPEDEVTTVEPPTNIEGVPYLGAYSANETSVGLVWEPSPDESSSEVLNPAYTIKVKDPGGVTLQTLTAVKGQTSATVVGLTEGTIYTFVVTMNIAATAVTDDSASVQWSPAKRRETEGGTNAPIQVFETASTSFPSGLDIYSAAIDGPQTLSLLGSSNSLIDLFVFTDTASTDLIIRSAHLSGVIPTPKTTFFSTEVDESDNLEFDRSAPPDASTYSTSAVTISGATSGITSGRIIYGRTQENNYFRLLVMRNNASLVFGTSPDRFLTLRISYQSVAGVQFAKPINPEPDDPGGQ
jgi:hypothetical protein